MVNAFTSKPDMSAFSKSLNKSLTSSKTATLSVQNPSPAKRYFIEDKRPITDYGTDKSRQKSREDKSMGADSVPVHDVKTRVRTRKQ